MSPSMRLEETSLHHTLIDMRAQEAPRTQPTPTFATEQVSSWHPSFVDPAPIHSGSDTRSAAVQPCVIAPRSAGTPNAEIQSSSIGNRSPLHHQVVDPALTMIGYQCNSLDGQHDMASPAFLTWNSSYVSSTPVPEWHTNPALSVLPGNTAGGQSIAATRDYPYQAIDHAPPGPLLYQCRWQGCRSTTLFRREHDLLRHLKSIHIRPDAYVCDIGGCRQTFGRRDHLLQHRRRRHLTSLQNLR
ncbi:hypothetical protein BJX99DRAFT_240108 [Aspergillus californicus]